MNRPTDELDRILDETLDGIRADSPDRGFVEAAYERVLGAVRHADAAGTPAREERSLHGCEDFRALMPDLLAGRVARPRVLLLQDHVNECVGCRNALHEMRSFARGRRETKANGGRWTRFSRVAWRLAAAAAVFVAIVGLSIRTDVFSFETGGLIEVRSVEGDLLRITDQGPIPVEAGTSFTLGRDEAIRTTKGSSAMLSLADDSVVELRERSEVGVTQRRGLWPGSKPDGVVDLRRGSVIIEASDQGSGHLFVDTEDCRVAVTGTVFAVNHGMKGSRVSVIEGEVHVDHDGRTAVLQPGDQTTTSPGLAQVPVEDEIAWSRNVERHIELLREMQALGREMDRAIRPGLRYSTELLDLMPAGTVIYVAVPNVSEGLGEAYRVLQQRIAGNPALQAWWQRSVAEAAEEAELDRIVETVRLWGDQLGEEIVIGLQLDDAGDMQAPVILTRLVSSETFASMLREEIARHTGVDDELPPIVIGEGALPPAEVAGTRHDRLYFWIRDGLLAVSPDADRLLSLTSSNGPTASPLETAFRDQLAHRYVDGVEWVVGVDLERILAGEMSDQSAESRAFDQLGLSDMQHLIAENEQVDDLTEHRAVLTFSQPRRGFASWLAEPAPLGSLDYVTPDAHFAVAFAMMEMEEQVDQLFKLISQGSSEFESDLAEFESEHGIDIRRDLAAPLGGEFTLALDGPVLPSPSWKLVMEVYDPATLQRTLEELVGMLNQKLADEGRQGLQLVHSESGGRQYVEIESLDVGLSAHVVFDEGYLVAGPSREILDRALQARRTGVNLPRSSAFLQLLPSDGRVNFSGVIYQHLGPLFGPFSGALGAGLSEQISPEQQQMLEAILAESRPGLALFYGERERIEFVATMKGGLFSYGLGTLFGFNDLLAVQESVLGAAGESVADR